MLVQNPPVCNTFSTLDRSASWLIERLHNYRGKVYRFMVNGQNGEVQGDSPKSGWKIFFLVLAILALLFIVLMLGGKK